MKKISYDYVKEFVEKKGYKLLTKENEYINSSHKLELICSKGHKCSIPFDNVHNNKSGCKTCGVEKRTAEKRTSFKTIIKNIEENGYKILEGLENYKNADSKLILECPEGHEWNTTYRLFYWQEVRCSHCSGFIKYTLEFAKEEFSKRGYKLLATEYKKVNVKMPYICSIHPNEIRYLSLSHLMNGVKCKECYIDSISGSNSRLWKDSLTDEERLHTRKYPEYEHWRLRVYKRDNYICQCCGIKGKNIVAHHLDGYHWCIEKRTDIDNGVTLCENCHAKFHKLYGNRENTKEQFYEFMIGKCYELKDGKNVKLYETCENG